MSGVAELPVVKSLPSSLPLRWLRWPSLPPLLPLTPLSLLRLRWLSLPFDRLRRKRTMQSSGGGRSPVSALSGSAGVSPSSVPVRLVALAPPVR
jgi:hypothetical protein